MPGIIYKLKTSVGNRFYIGSTFQTLERRFSQHKSASKKKKLSPMYKFFNRIGWNNVTIELIETIDTQNKKLLLAREQYHILKYHHFRLFNRTRHILCHTDFMNCYKISCDLDLCVTDWPKKEYRCSYSSYR
jgi:group I intron endonuclease